MVVHDFDIGGLALLPHEANAIPFIDPDAALARAIIHLPEKTKVYVIVPESGSRPVHFPSPRLVHPEQATRFVLETVEEDDIILAHAIAAGRNSIYLDLESPLDREKLADPAFYLLSHEDKLVILDEVQRVPELFGTLRGVIDQGRRKGRKSGRFLLLGLASVDLLRQSETLAGRIAYIELAPLDVLEVPADEHDRLWVCGGLPESFLATNESQSLIWRQNFIRTYLERDIPQLGPRVPATTLHRFWTMLAHVQGGLYNAAQLARGLDVDGKTVARYLDLLVDLMLVRRLQPFQTNAGKRLVKSPRVFVRDSGIVHALLNIGNKETLLGHPVVGASWEGFVIESLVAAAPFQTVPMFYRTAIGAEIDLLLETPKDELWAIDIKRGLLARPEKGFYAACEDLKPAKRFVVNSGSDRYQVSPGTEAIGVHDLAQILAAL